MGTGWRKAFCTTIPRDRRSETSTAGAGTAAASSDKVARSNPSTPRLRRKTASNADLTSPKVENCKITPKNIRKFGSTPSSPRSPFSILKNTVLRLSRNSCGVCTQSVKNTGHGTAIYTAECSHAFHFPCIASHVRKQGRLICPVCFTVWNGVPFLAIHTRNVQDEKNDFTDSVTGSATPPRKHAPVSTPKFAYADDEPLVTSPEAAGNFVAVPENGDEEVAEFQGFFVNPISSSDDFFRFNSNKIDDIDRDLRNVELSLSPEAAVISEGREHYTYAVVLRVKAPPAQVCETASRAAIDLVTVLDVSSSMAGAKMEMLKRAMRLVISSLGSADRLSVVAFSATPKRLLPLTRMTAHGQRAARRIIDRLSCSRGCSVAEGLKQATRVLEERRERNPVASIILLSDGQDDGVHDNAEVNERRGSSHTTRFAHVEIPLNSSGLGCQPAEDAFSKCVSGLLSVVVQDLSIQIAFASGSDPGQITAVYSCNERPVLLGSGCIRLGDLYVEEEKELFVEIRVPTARVGSHHVISAKCCYKVPTNREVINGNEQALLVPRPMTIRSGWPKIERLRSAFICSRAVAESRRLIEPCELSSAMQLLLSARALLLQSGSYSNSDYVKGLEAEMAEVEWQRIHQHRRAEE